MYKDCPVAVSVPLYANACLLKGVCVLSARVVYYRTEDMNDDEKKEAAAHIPETPCGTRPTIFHPTYAP